MLTRRCSLLIEQPFMKIVKAIITENVLLDMDNKFG
jgi:hypothetical protein